MIIVRLMGGLGNQMFQYAAGRRLANKNRSKVLLDLSWFDSIASEDTPRHFELECFRFEKNYIRPDKYVLASPEKNLKVAAYNYTKGLIKPRVLNYMQKGHKFDPAVLSLNGNVCLTGWWQNEGYFKDIRATILDDFEYVHDPSEQSKETLRQIKRELSVSLHIRRGDYISNKYAKQFHGLLSLSYYRSAVRHLEKSIGSKFTIFVFSDEPEWCKKNLKFKQPMVFVSHNKQGSDDLRLMRSCKHAITANSSFSWWGAWLNDNPQRIIIAPKRWFINMDAGSNEIVPESWIKL
jgi:hypothetical protein